MIKPISRKFIICLAFQIISYAKEMRRYQYIFLTPLSIDSVAGEDDIQIVQIQK